MGKRQSDRLTAKVLPALRENKNQSARDLGITTFEAGLLVKAALIVQSGTRKCVTGDGSTGRGRPAHLFSNTKKGNDRARRIAQRSQEPVAEVVAA